MLSIRCADGDGRRTAIRGSPYNRMEMQRPPITVSCDCGETREVPYGETWRCESCGRVWDTNQIPAEEYEGLLRRMRRARLEAFVIAAVLAAILVPLIVFWNPTLVFAIPALAA